MKIRNALMIAVILFVQIASNSYNEITTDFDNKNNSLIEPEISFSHENNSTGNNSGGNNSGGNNTGGNNTGGNNTGGNNTGGNNTGGNNTGGNNTGGNNTGGNNTGGNNTGGNNTGGNNTGGNNTGGNNTGGNNTGGNNTGGNNTGGNNTGGNNTGGNNTGGNNTGGNNTGGNNTGGNNTGGNNTGGNNTGGNNTGGNNDSHCLTVGNFSMNSTYFVTIDLINICSFNLNYPGMNISADHSGVSGFYNQTSWWYLIGANGTYNLSMQLQFDSTVLNGTNITLDFEAAILNCGTNGTWHDCPNSNNSTLSHQFQYIAPPTSLIIYSANLNSNYDRITLTYYSQNYAGYVNWEYNSSNGTSNHSSYSSSYLRTTYIYPSIFGTIEICASIPGDTTCVNVTRNVRPLYGEIDYPSNNSTTIYSSIHINYFAENYTSGVLEINNQTFYYLQSTNSNNGSNGSNSTSVNLPVGWSILCLKLTGDNGTSLADCIQIYRQAPVKRLILDSATLSTNNDYIVVRYHAENYSGYVDWAYNSSNGTSTSSSYANSYIRTAYIYPSTFGIIEICGTIDNYSTNECVSLNRTARMVEGGIISPSNNTTQNSASLSVSYYANNYSNGMITLNGVNYSSMGSSFDQNNSNGNSSNWGNGSNTRYFGVYIQYGYSTICLELNGEDGTGLSDCITVERLVPLHSVSITYPNTGVSFTGQYLNLSYTLENSSSHHFTVDGTLIYPTGNNTNTVQLNVGFGNPTVCVVSYDFTSAPYSDCITVTMLDPNADADSDGIVDQSDLCQNTPANEIVNYAGCSTSQLDSDADGVTDNLDICPGTQQFNNVDNNGCSPSQRDSDGDGIFDSNDLCPNTVVNSVVNAYGCANYQTDSDNDGVMDNLDICPNTIVGSQVNTNGCASNQLDSDSDGIVDSFDQCPNTIIGAVVDQTGCASTTTGNNSGNNNGSNSGNSSGSSGSEESSGLPGFEAIYLLVSVTIAIFVGNRKKSD